MNGEPDKPPFGESSNKSSVEMEAVGVTERIMEPPVREEEKGEEPAVEDRGVEEKGQEWEGVLGFEFQPSVKTESEEEFQRSGTSPQPNSNGASINPNRVDFTTHLELADIKKVFDRYDEDGSGKIDAMEITKGLLPDLGITKFSPADVEKLIREFDPDTNGEIDFGTFVQFYELLRTTISQKNGIADCNNLASVIREKKRQKNFMSERHLEARERIYKMLYDLPVMAPDYIYRRLWDVVVLVVMLYIWIVPTTVIAMNLKPTPAVYALDVLVTGLLSLDIIIILNTAVKRESQFALIVNRRQILANYFFNELMVTDVLAALPLYPIAERVTTDRLVLRLLLAGRLLKLLKFGFLFTFTNRGTMNPSFVRFYFWTTPLLKFAFKMLFIGHLMTLIRLLLSTSLPDKGCPEYGLDSCTVNIFEKYFYSFFWVWSLLTTQGTAALDGTATYAYAAVVMLMSLLLQGHVVAQMSAIMLKSNVKAQNQDSMRSTLAIMRHYDIPLELQQEVLSFQYHSLQQNASASLAHTLERLPPAMQREVGLYVKIDLVSKVPMFADLSGECRLAVANCLRQDFAEPNDFIIQYGDEEGAMYFMMHGFADVIVPEDPSDPDSVGHAVATIIRGDFFGEIALLMPELKRTASVQALTYCDLFRLDYDSVQHLGKTYPAIATRMEHEAQARGLRNKTDRRPPQRLSVSVGGQGVGAGLLRSVSKLSLKAKGKRRSLTAAQHQQHTTPSLPVLSLAKSTPRQTSAPSTPSSDAIPVPSPPPPQLDFSDVRASCNVPPVCIDPPPDSGTSPVAGPLMEVDVVPQIRRTFLAFAKQIEAAHEKSAKMLLKELKQYSQRISDLEDRLENVLNNVDTRRKDDGAIFRKLFESEPTRW